MYNLKDSGNSKVFEDHKFDVGAAAMSPNGNYVASADSGGQIHIWNPKTLRTSKSYHGPADPRDICWSPDSKRLCVMGTGTGKNRGVVIMADTGTSVGKVHGHTKAVMSCDYRQQ